MFNSAMVDVVVGMLFVFLVFSLVVSGINEGITRVLAVRSRQLWSALRELLDGSYESGDQRPRTNTRATDTDPLSMQLYANPLVRQLETAIRDERSRLPRIPKNEFSRGLIDVLVPAGNSATTVAQVRQALSNLPDDSPIKKPLLAIAGEAGEAVDKLREGIGEWFDARMTTLSTSIGDARNGPSS
jgi:hypothetical protein